MSRLTAQSRKAQASMEFMILFVLFLVAVGFALVVSVHRSYVISQAQVDLESNKILREVADKINIVYLEGDGFSMNATMPERILRLNYTIDINSNEVIIRVNGNTYVRYILTDNVTGDVVKGTNRILNRNGEIVITEAL
jgi:uncharacterized protein (UPF0333 family)